MDYSTAYRVQVFLTYGVGFLLVGIPAGVLLFLVCFVIYDQTMNLTALLFPRLLSKRAKQRTKTALAQSVMEYSTSRNFKRTGEPMHYIKRNRQAWIIRQHIEKESLHKPRKIDRNFFQKG